MAEEHTGVSIRISQLSNGVHEYHFSSAPSDLGLDVNFQRSVEIDATLEKGNRQLLLTVGISTSAMFRCDRCTEEFEQKLTSKYSLVYMYSTGETDVAGDGDVRMITPETPTLVLTGDIRDTVMLSVPLKLLCREDCRGLCPICGADWNRQTCSCVREEADSRWDSLKKLLKD